MLAIHITMLPVECKFLQVHNLQIHCARINFPIEDSRVHIFTVSGLHLLSFSQTANFARTCLQAAIRIKLRVDPSTCTTSSTFSLSPKSTKKGLFAHMLQIPSFPFQLWILCYCTDSILLKLTVTPGKE